MYLSHIKVDCTQIRLNILHEVERRLDFDFLLFKLKVLRKKENKSQSEVLTFILMTLAKLILRPLDF